MAYLVELDLYCEYDRCVLRAAVEVRNHRNERIGRFCNRHGAKRLAEIQAMEDGK